MDRGDEWTEVTNGQKMFQDSGGGMPLNRIIPRLSQRPKIILEI